MPTKIEKLLAAFQGNAYPAMLEDLGNSLGVTADSLRRLALGWAPIVEFKKGKNFQGWWVIPERDADAKPVGLSLRSQSHTKVMYPGSNHGLIYEVNPEHSEGVVGNDAGQWIRLTDAGVLCPVCGKPDGCLVNAAKPEDPLGDAVCIRYRVPQRPGDWCRPMKFGHLHSSQRIVTGVSALANNGGPVLIIEGMTDAAAGLDLGFDSVGRPSNLACMGLLCDLVRGRSVIIVGENDAKLNKHTGQVDTPGRDGMVAAFQMLKRSCTDVTMIVPPSHIKDLRAWKSKYGLTREQFLEHHAEHGESHAEELTLPDNRPLTIARAFLNSTAKMGSRFTIRRWNGAWWKYAGAKYAELQPEPFRQPFYPWCHDKQTLVVNPNNGAESLTPVVCNTALIGNVEDAIMSETLVPGNTLPCWVNGATGPDPKDLIVFSNGVLHVPAFLEGRPDHLLESTPDLFTTVALPFAFDPLATCPNWKMFLRTSLGDDADKIRLLREWFGYCLTSDTSMQKMMYLRGPTGAGKGVIVDVLSELLGEDQVANTSFSDLSGAHSLYPLLGKTLCCIPDARTPKHGDMMRGLELLLNITGGDAVQINPKYGRIIERFKLLCRIMIASNEFLEVPDHAGAMIRRLNIIEFATSHVANPDTKLRDKIKPEVAGIAIWALEGLRRLRTTGKFTVPASSEVALQEWRITTSPMAGFLEECTQPDPNGFAVKEELYDCWTKWSEERRIGQVGKGRFMERVRSNAPHSISDSFEKGGHKFSVFRGISIQNWAARKFLGRP